MIGYRVAVALLVGALAAACVVDARQALTIREQEEAIEAREVMLSGALDLLREQHAALEKATSAARLCGETF